MGTGWNINDIDVNLPEGESLDTNISQSANVIFSDFESTLDNGSSISSGWIDMNGADKVQFSGYASLSGMTVLIESKANDTDSPTQLATPITYNDGVFYLFNVICRQRFMRFTWTNTTGSSVSNASMEIKQTFGSSDKLSVFPLSVQPSIFSQAALVQSVQRGLDPFGVYQNVAVNEAGAVLQSDFGVEVARKLYNGYRLSTKFGRNPDIDIGASEDIWAGGGEYSGFNATENEDIEVFSASSNDSGSELSNGSATGGDNYTLIDSSATFITDGVSVGDCLINDTTHSHGFVSSVDSETQISVVRMTNGDITQMSNSSGDAYRIATSASTGAAVIRVEQILNSNFEEQNAFYTIMNGSTGVVKSIDAMRCTRAKVIMAGSNETNVGIITIRQNTTTSNVFARVPTTGQTTIAAYTVPKNKVFIGKRIRCSITRTNGSAGSATINLNIREPYGAWRAVRVFELQTGAPTEFTMEGGLVEVEGSDIKFTVESVSDNNTVAEAAIEFYLINE